MRLILRNIDINGPTTVPQIQIKIQKNLKDIVDRIKISWNSNSKNTFKNSQISTGKILMWAVQFTQLILRAVSNTIRLNLTGIEESKEKLFDIKYQNFL